MTATHPEQPAQYPSHYEAPGTRLELAAVLRTWPLPRCVDGGLGFRRRGPRLPAPLVVVVPAVDTQIVLVVGAMVVAPIFLAGIGRSTTGSTTSPVRADASRGSLRSWCPLVARLLPRQHGPQAATFVFFTIGGLMAMTSGASSRSPGLHFVDSQTFNGLVSVHATLMIFLFIDPGLRGPGGFAVPLDARRAGHGVPAPQRLVLAPAYRDDVRRELPRTRRRLRVGGRLRAALGGQPLGQTFFNMGVFSGPVHRAS